MRAATTQNIDALPVLDHDALEDVGNVLALIGRVLMEIQRLLPFHDDDRVVLIVEKTAHGLLIDLVRLVLN
jgi:hypothetical protein